MPSNRNRRARLQQALIPKWRLYQDYKAGASFSLNLDEVSGKAGFSRGFKQHFGTALRAFGLDNFGARHGKEFERVMTNQVGFTHFTALPIERTRLST